MYSFYVVRYTSMANNNDTVTDWYVLTRRDDVLGLLDGIDVHPELVRHCVVRVFEDGRVSTTVDLMRNVPDEVDEDWLPLDISGVELPDLVGTVLPPGHPVVVDGERLPYGCISVYN
jgi:hypothetical protein